MLPDLCRCRYLRMHEKFAKNLGMDGGALLLLNNQRKPVEKTGNSASQLFSELDFRGALEISAEIALNLEEERE